MTAGVGLQALVKAAEVELDDYRAILLKAVADRLAEAFAERLHERVRTEFWGYASEEALDNEALIAEAYTGIRPARAIQRALITQKNAPSSKCST